MSILGKLAAAVGHVALTPVTIVQDVVTYGGAITSAGTGRYEGPYTYRRLKRAAEAVEKALDEMEAK